jgi:hypothetical protein
MGCLQKWAPALYLRFRARELEEKRAQKKAKVPSAKEKKCDFALFLPPTGEVQFQSTKPLGRGESKGLE